MSSTFQPDLPTKELHSESEVIPDSLCNLDKATYKEGPNNQLSMFPYLQKGCDYSYFYSLPGVHEDTADEMVNKHGWHVLSALESDKRVKLHHLESDITYLMQQNQVGIDFVDEQKCGGKNSVWKDPGGGSKFGATPHLNNPIKDNIKLSDVVLPNENFRAELVNYPVDHLDSTVCDRPRSDSVSIDVYLNELLKMPEYSDMNVKKELEKKLKCQAESSPLWGKERLAQWN